MSDQTPSRPLQNLGSGEARALGLKVLGREAQGEFERATVFRDHQMRRGFTGAVEAQFPIIGRAEASYHIPGTEIDGQVIKTGERVIRLEDQLVAPVFIANIDDVLRHFEARGPYARSIGLRLARTYDKDVARTGVLAARSGPTIPGDYEGGGRAADASYATDGDALADAIFEGLVVMDQKDVPRTENDVKVFLNPLRYSLIVRSTSGRALNTDFNPEGNGSYATGQVMRINGAPLVRSNNLPTADDSANTDVYATRRADYSPTVALILHRDAVGTLDGVPVQTEAEYSARRQGTLVLGKYLAGHGILLPEGAYEIATS
jgi:hypothetical protein